MIAAENALLKLEGERLRATIARLTSVEQQLRAGPAVVPPAAPVQAAPPQPAPIASIGVLTPDERSALRSYFEFTNRLLPVGESPGVVGGVNNVA